MQQSTGLGRTDSYFLRVPKMHITLTFLKSQLTISLYIDIYCYFSHPPKVVTEHEV